jgi:site-specific recombinase XerD
MLFCRSKWFTLPRVRNDKGGEDGIVYLAEDCAVTLKRFLGIRPLIKIDNKNPLFFMDYDNFWDRRDVYRMFIHYKKKAGIIKPGGLHVFSRHTHATLMIRIGCDLRLVKELLQHNDIAATLRYAHVADETRRAAYDKAMVL